jgi:hypothetical protein
MFMDWPRCERNQGNAVPAVLSNRCVRGTGPAAHVAVLKHSSRVDALGLSQQVQADTLSKKTHDL